MSGRIRTWAIRAARAAFLGVLTLGLARPVLAQDPSPPWPEDRCAVTGNPDNPYEEKTLVCVPDMDEWNGILVVYAHGYVAPQRPLALPAEELGRVTEPGEPTLVERLLDWGFAFATTSYSKNGYAVEEADADLDELVDTFRTGYGDPPVPVTVLLVGASEGGLITLQQIEQDPLERYDGGLALCGPVAGMPYQIKYLGDFRVVFDTFFPEVFYFGAMEVPDWETHEAALAAWNMYTPTITSAIVNQPFKTNQLFRVTRAARAWSDPPGTAVETTLQVLFYNVFGMGDAIDTTGGVPYDNQDTWYWGSFNDWRLNRNVERVEGDEDAVDYTGAYYEPTGAVSRPLVTLHTTHDPAVPYRHELTYAYRVSRSGSEANVTQIPILRYGHCAFSTEEVLGAFGLLLYETVGSTTPALEEYRQALPQ